MAARNEKRVSKIRVKVAKQCEERRACKEKERGEDGGKRKDEKKRGGEKKKYTEQRRKLVIEFARPGKCGVKSPG